MCQYCRNLSTEREEGGKNVLAEMRPPVAIEESTVAISRGRSWIPACVAEEPFMDWK